MNGHDLIPGQDIIGRGRHGDNNNHHHHHHHHHLLESSYDVILSDENHQHHHQHHHQHQQQIMLSLPESVIFSTFKESQEKYREMSFGSVALLFPKNNNNNNNVLKVHSLAQSLLVSLLFPLDLEVKSCPSSPAKTSSFATSASSSPSIVLPAKKTCGSSSSSNRRTLALTLLLNNNIIDWKSLTLSLESLRLEVEASLRARDSQRLKDSMTSFILRDFSSSFEEEEEDDDDDDDDDLFFVMTSLKGKDSRETAL
jgi:hypothetical protein